MSDKEILDKFPEQVLALERLVTLYLDENDGKSSLNYIEQFHPL